uniref:(northern house mosquito) hypothetical protein n=1 Tax=Culex pipiens TaxID=7175 RepID=A0A8D8AGC8_CULPI
MVSSNPPTSVLSNEPAVPPLFAAWFNASKSVPDISELLDLLSSVLDSAGAGTILSRDSSLLLFCSEAECRCCMLSLSLTADSGIEPAAPKLEGASFALLDARLSIRLRSVDGSALAWGAKLSALGTTTGSAVSVEIGGSSNADGIA